MAVSTTANGRRLLKADIDTASTGNVEVVAAVPGRRITVVNILWQNETITLVSGKLRSASTDITTQLPLAASGGGFRWSGQDNEFFCRTNLGEPLNAILSGAVQTRGHVSYYLD